jgi:Zn finger protein HypA/HybF involved in hydrogenase expression
MEKDTTTLLQALIALMLILGIAMGMVYWVTATGYNNKVDTVKSSYSDTFKQLAAETTKSQAALADMQEVRFWCTDCHLITQQFHTPERITTLAVAKEREPRVCVHCHGFSIHTIHTDKLERGELECEKCHIVEGKLTKPKPLPGDILVCQQCHWDGNYIEIHITHGKATCLNCHVGGVKNVHKGTEMNDQKIIVDSVPDSEVDLSVVEIVP